MNKISELKLEHILAKNSFKHFCKYILKQKIGKMHEEWITAIENSGKNIVVIAPRGHFKTSILSIAYPLWHVYKNFDNEPQQILIQSSTITQSTEIMRLIKKQIEGVAILANMFMPPNVRDTTWSQKQIQLNRDHIIASVTFGDTIRGFHPNLSICDDILRTDNANIEEAKRIYYDVVFPITQDKPIEKAKQIIVGTPVSYSDLLFELKEKEEFCPTCLIKNQDGKCNTCGYESAFKILHYSAIITDEAGKWIAPSFPEHYTLEKLKKVRDNTSSLSWSRNYLCKPISDASSVFPYEQVILPAIQLYNEVMKDALQNERKEEKVVTRYLGVDVALGSSTSADYTVFIGLEKEENKPLVVNYIERKKGMASSEIVKHIEDLHQMNHYARIAIEKIGVGFGATKELQFGDKTMSAILPINYKGQQQKKEEIIGRMELLFRNRGIAIPEDQTLIEELQQMSIKETRGKQTFVSVGKHDDCVSALGLALYAAEMAIPTTVTFI